MAKGGQTPPEPGSPRMHAAWKLKEAGDVVAARHAARALLAAPSPPSDPSPSGDAAQAEELLRRATTPRALYGYAVLAAACFLLLVTLASTRY